MSHALVSILIPCYNAEKWLAETLESALAQTWKNIEIIVVDDGSTDNSLAIAKTFESNKLKVISQENRGASAARNRGLLDVQGDFIQYLDADDLLSEDKISLQLKLIYREGLDYIASASWARFFNASSEATFTPELVWKDMSPTDWLVCSWKQGGMMPVHGWLISRSISESAGCWNEDLSLNDDGEYFCRVILASKGVKFCENAKSFYRSGIRGSISRTVSYTAAKSALRSLELCADYLLSSENSPRTCSALATQFQLFAYQFDPFYSDLSQIAIQHVQVLGGASIPLSGGLSARLLSNIIGWKTTRKLQLFFYKYHYKIQ
jgi:glycosyltransferase involved in cell wall biosynthesis